MRRSALLTALLLLAVVASGCEKLPWAANESKPASLSAAPTAFPTPPTTLPSEVVAKVNGTPLSKHDVELALQEARANIEAAGGKWQPLALQDNPNDYDLPDIVNDLITVELRAKDALARGLDRQPDIQHRLYYFYRSLFAQEWVRWQLERINPSPEEIAEFYNKNKLGFQDPVRIQIRQLMVDSEEKAKAALVQLLQDVDFVELAKQVSAQPAAAQAPLAQQWVMRSVDRAAFAPGDETVRDLVDPVLEQAAFSLEKEGDVSKYATGPDGKFHIFQLVKRDPGRQKELVDVSDHIRALLQLDKLNELTEKLRKGAQIDRFPEHLEGVTQ